MGGISLRSAVIRIAYLKGYRVDQWGMVKSPLGKYLKLQARTTRGKTYLRFNIGVCKEIRSCGVMVHRLVAYQKYGEPALQIGIHTRHKNGNSVDNRPENILLGTASQNMMDRPIEERRAHAAKGVQKHSLETILKIRQLHDKGFSYRDIEVMMNLPKSTISYYLSSGAKKTSYKFPNET